MMDHGGIALSDVLRRWLRRDGSVFALVGRGVGLRGDDAARGLLGAEIDVLSDPKRTRMRGRTGGASARESGTPFGIARMARKTGGIFKRKARCSDDTTRPALSHLVHGSPLPPRGRGRCGCRHGVRNVTLTSSTRVLDRR